MNLTHARRASYRPAAPALLLMLLAAAPLAATAQEGIEGIEGSWTSLEDDGTRSRIEIVREPDGYAGRVRHVENRDGKPLQPNCARCPAPYTDQPMLGLRFLWALQPQADGRSWRGGQVMDLRDGLTQGTIANAELSLLPDGRLKLLGYLGLRALGQSRIWERAPDAGALNAGEPAPETSPPP